MKLDDREQIVEVVGHLSSQETDSVKTPDLFKG